MTANQEPMRLSLDSIALVDDNDNQSHVENASQYSNDNES